MLGSGEPRKNLPGQGLTRGSFQGLHHAGTETAEHRSLESGNFHVSQHSGEASGHSCGAGDTEERGASPGQRLWEAAHPFSPRDQHLTCPGSVLSKQDRELTWPARTSTGTLAKPHTYSSGPQSHL